MLMCPLGAFSFYLLFRFHVSGEMDDGVRPDFTTNEAWFMIKIMTDGTKKNLKEMNRESYSGPLKKIFKKLRIISSKICHFGRVNGAIALELKEVAAEWIRILGKCACILFVPILPSYTI